MGMNRDSLEKLYAETLPRMQNAMGLDRWRLHVHYGTCQSDASATAECTPQPDYEMACLRFNPDEIEEEDTKDRHGALDVLRHELIHVVISATNQHHEIVDAAVGFLGQAAVADTVAVSKLSTDERIVRSIETMLDGLGQTASTMAMDRP